MSTPPVPGQPKPTTLPKVTEPDIVSYLLQRVCEPYRNIVMPHFTPSFWSECDVAQVSPAGYLTEYEIKVSRSDFRADFKKVIGLGHRNKHEAIEKGQGPKHFYFCAPVGIIPLDEVPEYAGLIEFEWVEREGHPYGRLKEDHLALAKRMVKSAPKIKAKKLTEKYIQQVHKSAYFRLIRKISYDRDLELPIGGVA